MAEACVWKPKVKAPNGELKDSKLFEDLLSLKNHIRKETVPLYGYLKSEDFKSRYGKKVSYDENGEPLLESVINNATIKGVLDDISIAKDLTFSIGGLKKDGSINYLEDNNNNYADLVSSVLEFNRNSKYKDKYVAVIRKSSDNIYISVERLTDENSTLAKSITSSYYLNERIKNLLGNYGISIGHLNTLQEELRINGVVDYQNARTTADGLIEIIKLAEGSIGEAALPEEFAHFIIDVMSNDIMVQRLLNLSSQEGVIKNTLGDEYESYIETYSGDQSRIQREVAGKLLADAFFRNTFNSRYNNLFSRVIERVKNFFKNIFSSDELTKAIIEAENIAGNIANIVLVDDSTKKIELDKLKSLPNLYQLSSSSSKAAQVIQKSINNTVKEYSEYLNKLNHKINQESDPNKKSLLEEQLQRYRQKIQDFIGGQQRYLATEQYKLGIENFIEYASNELSQIVDRLTTLINSNMSNVERATLLRNCKNIINSNEPTLRMIQQAQDSGDVDFILDTATLNRLEKLGYSLSECKERIYSQSVITFKDYIEEFIPEEGITITSNNSTRKVTREDLEDLLKTADKDLSILDTWIQSMAESNDLILKLADQALKASKERKRQRVLKVKKELLALAKELKNAGIDTTDFMFEKHRNGKLGNRYISEIDYTKYKDDEAKMRAETKGLPNQTNLRREWYITHFNSATNTPNSRIYGVNLNEVLPEGSIQRKYYDYFMQLRDDLISYLPGDYYKRDPYKAIQISQDLWERVKSSSPSTWGKQVWETIKRKLVTTTEDTHFGVKATFEGEEAYSLPIFFVKDIEDENALSRDTVSTMLAFADMAINYDEMFKVADYFELGKDVIARREATIQKKGKPAIERLAALGNTYSQKLTSSASNIMTRYNEFLRSQLYGRYMRDGILIEGENWEIKSNKAASLLNEISSLNQLALNGLAGIAAVGNDMINVESEALAGQYFNNKHLKKADSIYLKELPGLLGEVDNPIKSNKLSLFIELFDVLHEYDLNIKDIEWDKNKIKKLMSSNSLYIFMQMGSHWGETRTSLAQAQKIKIKSDDGTKESSLWDILEVQYVDPNDHSKGAKLGVKEGYSLSEADITKYTRKFMGLNERLFGIYNMADRNALQSTAVGQLVFLYRKFIVPSINRRFGGANYNLDLDEQTEGYYRSFGRFLWNLSTDARGLGRSMSLYWKDMSDNEKANCIRAINELSMFVTLSILAAVLSSAGWAKKDNPWHRRFLAYMSKRMSTEAGAFTPFGVFGETWNIIKSPAAGVNTLENLADCLDVLNPFNYETIGGEEAIVKSGRYKGHNKAYRAVMNSPFVPMNKTIYKLLHPEESIVAFN